AVARQQGVAQTLLESLDLHRHGGLGLVHPTSRFGEAAAIGNGAEGLQLIEVERRGHGCPSPKLIIRMKSICWTNGSPARYVIIIGVLPRRSLAGLPPAEPFLETRNGSLAARRAVSCGWLARYPHPAPFCLDCPGKSQSRPPHRAARPARSRHCPPQGSRHRTLRYRRGHDGPQ